MYGNVSMCYLLVMSYACLGFLCGMSFLGYIIFSESDESIFLLIAVTWLFGRSSSGNPCGFCLSKQSKC